MGGRVGARAEHFAAGGAVAIEARSIPAGLAGGGGGELVETLGRRGDVPEEPVLPGGEGTTSRITASAAGVDREEKEAASAGAEIARGAIRRAAAPRS